MSQNDVQQAMHDNGECVHERDHDRSLPDGSGYDVEYEPGHFVTMDDFEAAKQFAREHDVIVCRGDQRVADDGQLGCNDCGEPLYYCQNTGWYHHVEASREDFLAWSSGYDYYAEAGTWS